MNRCRSQARIRPLPPMTRIDRALERLGDLAGNSMREALAFALIVGMAAVTVAGFVMQFLRAGVTP